MLQFKKSFYFNTLYLDISGQKSNIEMNVYYRNENDNEISNAFNEGTNKFDEDMSMNYILKHDENNKLTFKSKRLDSTNIVEYDTSLNNYIIDGNSVTNKENKILVPNYKNGGIMIDFSNNTNVGMLTFVYEV